MRKQINPLEPPGLLVVVPNVLALLVNETTLSTQEKPLLGGLWGAGFLGFSQVPQQTLSCVLRIHMSQRHTQRLARKKHYGLKKHNGNFTDAWLLTCYLCL